MPVYPKLHVQTGKAPVVKQNPPFLHFSTAQNGVSHNELYNNLKETINFNH